MRAIAITEYGSAESLRVAHVPEPVVGPDFVLVRARAAGVNPVDTYVRQGGLAGRFASHFPLVLGWDVAGVVEAVGPSVHELAVGDEVMGYVRRDELQHGTYAELVPAPIRTLARKPSSVGFAEAAGLPLVGLTAWQALDAAAVTRGDTVLVHAAAGGVGSTAVQLAVHRGARVLGTASAGNHDYLRSLGAEPVEYGDGLVGAVRDLAPDGVDAALDLVGGHALPASADLVADAGRIVSIVDADAVKALGGRYIFVRPDPVMLASLADLVDAGALRLHVSHEMPLDEAAEAHRLVEGRHVRGKVVLTIGS